MPTKPKHPELEMAVVTITPDVAAEWLEGHVNFRKMNDRKVDQFAAEMAAGNWRLDGAAIRFNKGGDLLDGQHRLMACVTAGVSFTTVVIKGVDESTLPTMDTGTPRKLSDFLAYKNVPNAVQVQAVVSLGWRYEHPTPSGAPRMIKGTVDEMLAWHDEAPDVQWAVRQANRASKSCRCRATALAVSLMAARKLGWPIEALEPFVDDVCSDIQTDETSPALAFRRFFQQQAMNKSAMDPDKAFAYTIKALAAYLNQTPIKILSVRFYGSSKETWPTLPKYEGEG